MTLTTIILRAPDCWSVWSYAKFTAFNDACDRFGHCSPASDSRWNTHSARSWQAIPSHCNLESQRQQPATNSSKSVLQSESLWSFPIETCWDSTWCAMSPLLAISTCMHLHERIFTSLVVPHSHGPIVGNMQTLRKCWMLASSMFFMNTSQRMELIWTLVTVLPRVEYTLRDLKLGNRLHLTHSL